MKPWLRAVLGSLALVGLVACGPGGLGDVGDDLGDGGGGGGSDDDQRWQLVLSDMTSITGTSALLVTDSSIVLSQSTPEGWIVTFTTEEPIDTTGVNYASDNAERRVGASIEAPSGDTCTVEAGSGGTRFVLLTVSDIDTDDVPLGIATFVDTSLDCINSDVQGGGSIGFGAP